jgi:hypothetical protein
VKFALLAFNNSHYASNILQADTLLKWDALGNTHQLIIRGEFGAHIEFTAADGAEIEKHGNDQILSGKEIRYADNRFFAFLPRGYVNNYTITVSPSKYAVFCCEYDGETDVCKLYVPNAACQYQCDVSASVEVRLTHEEAKKGFLGRLTGKHAEKDYFTLYIPNIPGYAEGSLHYTFDGCKYKYPITKAMLGKPVSIPSFNAKAPKLESSSGNGYKIIIRQ